MKTKGYSANTIANFFIRKAHQAGQEISPLKVIKLVYLAHGWNLAILDAPLINEQIECWKYGPVVMSLYQELRRYEANHITQFLPQPVEEDDEINQSATKEILESVWSTYSNLTAGQLSFLTHEPNSPWDIAWHQEQGKEYRNYPIKDEIIKSYYKNKINKQ